VRGWCASDDSAKKECDAPPQAKDVDRARDQLDRAVVTLLTG
jgi:hypothetical protein